MRFIAAIPNYNHGKTLIKLLDQLLEEDFDAIYVLDDASTDDSLKLLKPYEDKIKLIKGPYRAGPGGNRNRILPYISADDIIMFIDADMALITKDVREKIVALFEEQPKVALFGGGIKTKKNKPMTYNYGQHHTQIVHWLGLNIEKFAMLLHFKPLVRLIRPLAKLCTYNVEIRFFEPVERTVASVSEAHFYIRAGVFEKLGGFDDTLHYHEGGELAYRLRSDGYIIKFTPVLWAKHLEVHSRKKLRKAEAKKLNVIIRKDKRATKKAQKQKKKKKKK